MAPYWEPGTQYEFGSVVQFEGNEYKIIQPHRSQSDWTPSVTPALWGRLQDGDQHRHDQHEHQHGPSCAHGHGQGGPPAYQPPPQDSQQQQGPDPQKYSQSHGFNDGGSDHSDSDEDEKNPLKLAAGIGAGALAIGAIGAGIFAYSKHKSKKAEEAKKEAFHNNVNFDKWLEGALYRRKEYDNSYNKPPVFWYYTEGPNVPQNAIQVGNEADGKPLYASRVEKEGGLHLGKAGRHLGGAAISYGGKEILADKYEVLVGDPRAIVWKRFENQAPYVRGWQPTEGGREASGEFLFLARTNKDGGIHPGKVHEGYDHIDYPYGGKENTQKEFEIAAYA